MSSLDRFNKIRAISDAEFIERAARMLSNELNSNPYSNIRVANYIRDITDSVFRLQNQLLEEKSNNALTPLEKIAIAEHLLRSALNSEDFDVILYAVNSDSESIQLDENFEFNAF